MECVEKRVARFRPSQFGGPRKKQNSPNEPPVARARLRDHQLRKLAKLPYEGSAQDKELRSELSRGHVR